MPKRNTSHPTGDKTPKKTPARKRQPPFRLGHEEENQRPKEPRQQSPAVNSDSNQDIIVSLVQSQILMQAQMDTLTEKVDQLVSGQTYINEGPPGVSVRCAGNPSSINVTQTHTENPLITTANHGNTHPAPSTGVSVRCSGNENNTKGPENITLDPQPSTSTGANGLFPVQVSSLPYHLLTPPHAPSTLGAQQYPAALNAMLTYAQHVKDLMRNGAHWRMYDTVP